MEVFHPTPRKGLHNMIRTWKARTRLLAGLLATLLATLVPAGALGAGVDYKNFTTQPFSETDVSCTGETVEISGVIRHHVVFVNDAAGGFHGNGIFVGNASGESVTGTRYVASFTDRLTQYIAAGDAPVTVTDSFSFRLISNDGTPNLYVTGFFHLTLTAAGVPVVDASNFDVICR